MLEEVEHTAYNDVIMPKPGENQSRSHSRQVLLRGMEVALKNMLEDCTNKSHVKPIIIN